MKSEHIEALWLHESQEFSLGELCELSGLSDVEIRELVEYGVLTPANPETSQWSFTANYLVTARTARRLRRDLELDQHGVALVMKLLERVQELEAQICDLRAKFPGARR